MTLLDEKEVRYLTNKRHSAELEDELRVPEDSRNFAELEDCAVEWRLPSGNLIGA